MAKGLQSKGADGKSETYVAKQSWKSKIAEANIQLLFLTIRSYVRVKQTLNRNGFKFI